MGKIRVAYFLKAARVFFCLAFIPPVFAFASEYDASAERLRDYAVEHSLWKDDYWQKLLYYRKTFSGVRGNSVDKNFYISEKGIYDPKSEFLAEIDGFFQKPADINDMPECLFPQRYFYLRKILPPEVNVIKSPVCPVFEKWKSTIDASGAGLVFAGSDLNNPSTLYGHTFLRLYRKRYSGRGLMDYTVNYAADTGDSKGLLYIVKGLTGSYPGRFSTVPFYLKVQEYSNWENRDLWEYPLDLSREEMETLYRHGWELGRAAFPYYFFNRNCSWQLLPYLDIIRPTAGLEKRFSGRWGVIPSDTAKAVARVFSGGEKTLFRPSGWRTVDYERARLSGEQRKAVGELVDEKSDEGFEKLKAFSAAGQASVLEVSADYLKWKNRSGKLDGEEYTRRSGKIFAARSILGKQETPGGEPDMPYDIRDSHGSLRTGAGFIYSGNEAAYEISARPALHGLTDYSAGYMPDVQLEMMNLRVRYMPERKRLYAEEITLVRVVNLLPWDSWSRKPAWAFSVGARQVPENYAEEGKALVFGGSADAGISLRLPFGPGLFYTLAEASADAGSVLDEGWRAGGGVKSGFYFDFVSARAAAGLGYMKYPSDSWNSVLSCSFDFSYSLTKDLALSAGYKTRKGYHETGVYAHLSFEP